MNKDSAMDSRQAVMGMRMVDELSLSTSMRS